MMEGCSRDVEGEEEDSMKASFGEDVEGEEKDSMKAALREGISLVINSWWLIRRFVRRARGDDGLQPELKLNGLYDCLFSCLIQSNDLPSAKIALKAHLTSFLGDITDPLPADNSLQEVCEQLVAMYQECLQGDLSSIQIIKEANSWKKANNKYEVETDDPFFERRREQAFITARDRVWEEMLFEARIKYLKKIKKFKKARLLIRGRKQKMASKFQMETPSSISIQLTQKANISSPLLYKQANSSEMDGIRVFKEGVDLLMNNLWLYIPCGCGSTSNSSHSRMIQRLADYILFWFTQTIKPVSFDYIEWILRNELCSLPITVGAVTNDITKEVAEKLMVMYEECLKGNFTSVKILREENLCSPSCSTSCNETTACLDPDQFREFKLVKKAQLGHNVAKFTFALPTPTSVLGLPIGQHICCRGKDGQGGEVIKSYTPTTLDSDVGHFELVIKRHPQARMSCYFHEMRVGDYLAVKGPKGRFKYQPGEVRAFGMLAAGSGITPMFQVARAILENPNDKTEVHLIYANVTFEDILLKEELDGLATNYPDRFKIYYVLNQPPAVWDGGVGFVSKEMIQAHLPPPAQDIKILKCVPPPMKEAVAAHLKALDYAPEMQFHF